MLVNGGIFKSSVKSSLPSARARISESGKRFAEQGSRFLCARGSLCSWKMLDNVASRPCSSLPLVNIVLTKLVEERVSSAISVSMMLRRCSRQSRSLLRCFPDLATPQPRLDRNESAFAAPQSRLATLSAASRTNDQSVHGASAGKLNKSSSDGPEGFAASPIYPDSKAAERRHPHAPRLFEHSSRPSARQDTRQSKRPSTRRSNDSYILRNVSTDPELRQLYTSLGEAADSHDALKATNLCQLIKERKKQMANGSTSLTFEPEEKVVFLAVMRALAHHGLLEEVQAMNADMLSFGFEECIDSLNLMLQAAVVSADEGATSAVLERIFALRPSSSTALDRSEELAKILLSDRDQSKPSRSGAMTLPVERMRNWNAATFAYMVDNACQEHNLEFALLLLSTCYRMGLILPHDTLRRLVGLCLECNEFRAAVELADLIEQGGLVYRHPTPKESNTDTSSKILLRSEARSGQVARRFAPSIWMSILRSCAEGGYLPGVEIAWSRAVTQGLLTPDDGLLQMILALAAKEGSVQMARVCLHHIDPSSDTQASVSNSSDEASRLSNGLSRKVVTPSKGIDLQEWHLAPLFEAECSARDYKGAFGTLRAYFHRGFKVTDGTTSRISTSIYPDRDALRSAREALGHFALEPKVGTHIAIVNAVLAAAVWLGDLAQALEIYRAVPSYYTIADSAGDRPSWQPIHLSPKLETFNSLLSGCIDAADYETGVGLLKDLNEHRVRPDVTTFERMIVLCLTQSNYDNAFGFIEEAKEKGITPSRKSYEALVRKCFQEKDHRWEGVLADMSENGYRPSRRLLLELDLDPSSFDINKLRS